MKLLWDIVLGYLIGSAIALAGFAILMVGLRSCINISEAQTADVRITENDHTIDGIYWPGVSDPMADSAAQDAQAIVDNARIDFEYALEDLDDAIMGPPKYPSHAACVRDNEGIARLVKDLGDFDLEARTKRLQNDCTEFLP